MQDNLYIHAVSQQHGAELFLNTYSKRSDKHYAILLKECRVSLARMFFEVKQAIASQDTIVMSVHYWGDEIVNAGYTVKGGAYAGHNFSTSHRLMLRLWRAQQELSL